MPVLADRRRLGHDRPVGRRIHPRRIAIVAYAGVQSLDVTGPLEVLAGAQRLVRLSGREDRGYDVRVVSRDGAPGVGPAEYRRRFQSRSVRSRHAA